MGINEQVINSILEAKYTSPDGTLKNVFEHDRGSMIFRCVLCSATCQNDFTLYQHAYGKRHQRVIGLVDVCRDKLIIEKPQQIKTENVRPRNSVKVKTSKLELEIGETRIGAIIGLEYIIESISNSETYWCVLCKLAFDKKSHVINHLTASQHRLKYLQKHFPRVFEEINYLTQTVCETIEEKFGRLSVLLVDENEFRENRLKFIEIVMNMKHIDENMGSLDLLKTTMKEKVEGPVKIETVSISSDESSENEDNIPVDVMSSNYNSRSTHIEQQEEKIKDEQEEKIKDEQEEKIKDQQGENIKDQQEENIKDQQEEKIRDQQEEKIKDQQKNTMSSNYSSRQNHVEKEEDKIKSFRLQMAAATKELKITYLTYSSNPYTYPGYYDKWVVFWNTRYKELGYNNTGEFYDWQKEWSSEWKKTIKENFEKDLQSKRSELKEKLGILSSDDFENTQLTTKTSKDADKGLCTTLRGSSVSTSHSSQSSNFRKRSRSPTPLNSPRGSHYLRRSGSPRRSHNTPRSRRSRSPRKSYRRKSDYSPSTRYRRKSYYSERSASRSLYSPRRSRSPQKIQSNRRSSRNNRSPDKSSNQTSQKNQPPQTTGSEKIIPIKSAESSKTSFIYTQSTLPQNQKRISEVPQKDLSSGKCHSPLRLEKLVELYQRDSDFLISWKELLKILNIDDNDNVPALEANAEFAPSQIINDNAIDGYVRKNTSDCVELNKCNKVTQHPPCHRLEELVVDSEYVDKPITIISVLGYLIALEDLLGPSLCPKLIELMIKAQAMDKSNANSSNTLLDDNESYILFQTIKEKLKGLLIADLVEGIKRNAVKKAIKDMEYLIHQATEREKIDRLKSLQAPNVEETPTDKQIPPQMEPCSLSTPSYNDTKSTQETNFKKETSAMPVSKKGNEEENTVSTDVTGYEDTILTDSELMTLIEKYSILSENEKQDFIDYMKRLESTCPGRIKRLRNKILNTETQSDLNENLDETIVISDEETP